MLMCVNFFVFWFLIYSVTSMKRTYEKLPSTRNEERTGTSDPTGYNLQDGSYKVPIKLSAMYSLMLRLKIGIPGMHSPDAANFKTFVQLCRDSIARPDIYANKNLYEEYEQRLEANPNVCITEEDAETYVYYAELLLCKSRLELKSGDLLNEPSDDSEINSKNYGDILKMFIPPYLENFDFTPKSRFTRFLRLCKQHLKKNQPNLNFFEIYAHDPNIPKKPEFMRTSQRYLYSNLKKCKNILFKDMALYYQQKECSEVGLNAQSPPFEVSGSLTTNKGPLTLPNVEAYSLIPSGSHEVSPQLIESSSDLSSFSGTSSKPSISDFLQINEPSKLVGQSSSDDLFQSECQFQEIQLDPHISEWPSKSPYILPDSENVLLSARFESTDEPVNEIHQAAVETLGFNDYEQVGEYISEGCESQGAQALFPSLDA